MSDMQQLIRREFNKDDGIEMRTGPVCACRAPLNYPEKQEEYALHAYRGGCGECACPPDAKVQVCGFGVEDGILAAVYAPMNRFAGVYDVDTAFRRGTMFEELDKPFYGDGKGVDCRGNEK